MRKTSTKKSSAAALLASPPPPSFAMAAATRSPTISPAESPAVLFDFNLNGFADIATSLKKKSSKNGSAGASGCKRMQPTEFSPSQQQSLKSIKTISDLKDIEASHCRLVKLFKDDFVLRTTVALEDAFKSLFR